MLVPTFDGINTSNMDSNKNHQGNLNPFYGHRHSAESKQKISDSQKIRYQQYRDALDNQHHVSMDEFLQAEAFRKKVSQIIREEITKLL